MRIVAGTFDMGGNRKTAVLGIDFCQAHNIEMLPTFTHCNRPNPDLGFPQYSLEIPYIYLSLSCNLNCFMNFLLKSGIIIIIIHLKQ